MGAINWSAFGEVASVSLAAGVGMTLILCVALIGASRRAEALAAHRNVQATLYGALAVIGFVAILVVVAIGLKVMVEK